MVVSNVWLATTREQWGVEIDRGNGKQMFEVNVILHTGDGREVESIYGSEGRDYYVATRKAVEEWAESIDNI